MAQLVLPRVQAMLICDDVAKSSKDRGVYHLTGVRHSISVPSFPAIRPHLYVFLHMSGHRGATSCLVRVLRVATDEIVYESSARNINFKDPTAVRNVIFDVRNCEFPELGVYYVEIVADNKVVGERRLEIRLEQ